MYEEQHGESEYAYLLFKLGLFQGLTYCQKQECFPSKDYSCKLSKQHCA